MNLRQLNYLMKDYGSKLYVNRRDIWNISRVLPLADAETVSERDGVLFVSDETDIGVIVSACAGMNVLIFSDSERELGRREVPSLNLMVIGDAGAREPVLELIGDYVSGRRPAPDYRDELLNALVENTFEEGTLISTITAIVGNPVGVFDMNFKALASSLREGSLIPEYIALNSEQLIGEMQNGTPKIFQEPGGKRFLIVSSSLNGLSLGYVVMVEVNIACELTDYDLLLNISKAVSIEMLKGKYTYVNDAVSEENFLLRLVSGEAASNRYIEKLSLILGVTSFLSSDCNYVAVLRVPREVTEYNTLRMRFLLRDAKSFFGLAITAAKSDHLVILFQGGADYPLSEETGEHFEAFLKKNGILAGISSAFHGLAYVREYYDQAVNAAMLFERIHVDRSYIAMQDYLFFDLLMAISGRKRLQNYISGKVMKLIQADRRDGTDNLETLRRLLENGCNIKKTAEKMFIHRNTLLYRVRKMEAISGLDIDDDEDMFNARMSVKILEFMSRPVRKTDDLIFFTTEHGKG